MTKLLKRKKKYEHFLLRKFRVCFFISLLFVSLRSFPSADTTQINKWFCEYQSLIDTDYATSRQKLGLIMKNLEKLPSSDSEFRVMKYAVLAMREGAHGNIAFGDSISLLALHEAEHNNNKRAIAEAYLARANIFLIQGDLSEAQEFYTKSIEYNSLIADSAAMIGSFANLAQIRASQGNIEGAIEYYNKAIQLCRQYNKTQFLAETKINLAIEYYHQNRLSESLLCNIEAIQILDSIGSKQSRLYPVHNLALLYKEMGMDSLSNRYFKEVYTVSKENNNHTMVAHLSVSIGDHYLNHGNLELGFQYMNEAYQIVEDHGVDQLLGIVNIGLANVWFKLEDYIQAKAYYNKGLEIALSSNEVENQIDAMVGLAKCLRIDGKEKQALTLLLSAKELAVSLNSQVDLYETSEMIAEIYYQQGLHSQAVEHYKTFAESFKAYVDTTMNEQNRNFAYQTELKEQENKNALLQKEAQYSSQIVSTQNKQLKAQRYILLLTISLLLIGGMLILQLFRTSQQRKKANGQLQASNQEVVEINQKLKKENEFKNKLFSIVSHDLRSPVASLYSMLQVLSMNQLNKDEQQILLHNVMESTENSLELIDNVLLWTQKQMINVNPEITDYNINHTAQNILNQNKAKIKNRKLIINNNIPASIICRGDENIARLVLRNLLSNAIKFSKEGAVIDITHQADQGKAIISVKDTAGGVPPKLKELLYSDDEFISTKGEISENGNGMGLKLCRYFLLKTGNNIWFETEQGVGTRFYFTLDIPLS